MPWKNYVNRKKSHAHPSSDEGITRQIALSLSTRIKVAAIAVFKLKRTDALEKHIDSPVHRIARDVQVNYYPYEIYSAVIR
jgi:hypothetical protein